MRIKISIKIREQLDNKIYFKILKIKFAHLKAKLIKFGFVLHTQNQILLLSIKKIAYFNVLCLYLKYLMNQKRLKSSQTVFK